jgi:hypothetical protein
MGRKGIIGEPFAAPDGGRNTVFRGATSHQRPPRVSYFVRRLGVGCFPMIGSPEINKVLRRELSPTLRSNGFHSVTARKAWAWYEKAIWVFEIRAVGSHFSSVTGWPPMSVGVWLGVFHLDQTCASEIKKDAKGRLIPAEFLCHLRSELTCTIDQSRLTRHLSNPAERKRDDIWWIEPDGSNTEEVVANIRQQLLEQGLSWYRQQPKCAAVKFPITIKGAVDQILLETTESMKSKLRGFEGSERDLRASASQLEGEMRIRDMLDVWGTPDLYWQLPADCKQPETTPVFFLIKCWQRLRRQGPSAQRGNSEASRRRTKR